MQTTKQYRRLTPAEREEISRCLAQGENVSAIASHLGRETSTISREVNRNSGKSIYRAFSASRRAHECASSRRQGKSRLAGEDRLRQCVIEKLRKR